MAQVIIETVNFNGETGLITFFPDTGGTFNLGTQLLPYTYISDYVFGTYAIYFSNIEKQCTLIVPNTAPPPTPTPTPTITPTPTVTSTPTSTPLPGFDNSCGSLGSCGSTLVIIPFSIDTAQGANNGQSWLNGQNYTFNADLCGYGGSSVGYNGTPGLLIGNNAGSFGIPVDYTNINSDPFTSGGVVNAIAYPLCRCTTTPEAFYWNTNVSYLANNGAYDPFLWGNGVRYNNSIPTWILNNGGPALAQAIDCSSPCRQFKIFTEQPSYSVSYVNSAGSTVTATISHAGGPGFAQQTITSRTVPIVLSGSGALYFNGICGC